MTSLRQQPHCLDCKCALAGLRETIEILVESEDLFGGKRPVLVCAVCHQRRVRERQAVA